MSWAEFNAMRYATTSTNSSEDNGAHVICLLKQLDTAVTQWPPASLNCSAVGIYLILVQTWDTCLYQLGVSFDYNE